MPPSLSLGYREGFFREKNLAYMVTKAERPNNHPIYALDTEMGLAIFFTKGGKDSCSSQNVAFVPTQEELEGVWDVIFDGETCKEGAGARFWVRPPGGRDLNYS